MTLLYRNNQLKTVLMNLLFRLSHHVHHVHFQHPSYTVKILRAMDSKYSDKRGYHDYKSSGESGLNFCPESL